MAERDFLTAHGWAFMAIRDAKAKVESAPESLRYDLESMLSDVEYGLADDLMTLVNRAGTAARRIAQVAAAAHPSTEANTDISTDTEGGEDG